MIMTRKFVRQRDLSADLKARVKETRKYLTKAILKEIALAYPEYNTYEGAEFMLDVFYMRTSNLEFTKILEQYAEKYKAELTQTETGQTSPPTTPDTPNKAA
jgi:hypothetical protein